MKLSVPEFSTLQEFVTWWQKPQTRSVVLQDPQTLSRIASHPNITVWLDRLFKELRATHADPPTSKEETVRLLATSSPGDSAFIAKVVKNSKDSAGETGEIEMVDRFPSFGRYRIKRKIAEGGFGAVYEAYDPQLDRTVALKLLKLRTEDEIEQFEKEAKLAANLRHPGIIAVHELGVLENQPYFTMDFIEGRTVRDLLNEKGRLLTEEAFRIAATVADALSYAHSSGIIHRDMKPENVFVDTEDRIYVGDFGIAKQVRDATGKVTSSRVVGTPHYMSPEQASGERLDARTDVWSLGIMLYEMLCGTCPFEGRGSVDIFRKIWFAEPTRLRRLIPRLDRDAETIVMKCIEKDVGRRYASAAKMKADIDRHLQGEHIEARPVSAIEKLWRRLKKNKAVSLSIAAGLIAVIAVGLYFWRQSAALGLLRDGMATANPDVAVEKIEKALEVLSRDWSAHQQYGLALERAGRADNALTVFETAAQIAKQQENTESRAESLYRISLIHWNNQDFEHAKEVATQAEELAQGRKTVVALTLQARRLTADGNYEKALKAWEKAFQLDKGNPITLFYKASTLTKLKGYSEAIDTYTRALWEFEKSQNKAWLTWCYNNRGMVKHRKGDYDGAIADCSEALRLDPKSVYALHNRGIAKKENGDFEGALADYNEALRLAPARASTYQDRGILKTETGDHDGAFADYNEAIRLDPGLAAAYTCRGNLKRDTGDDEGALADHNKAIKLDPQNASAYNNRGWLRYMQKDYDSAMADYRKAIECDPSFALPYRNIGRVLSDKGRNDEAISFYNKAIERNPNDVDSYNNRGHTYSEMGEYKKAMADYNKALEINPKHALTLNNRGVAVHDRGDIDAAAADYQEAMRADPKLPLPHYNMGRVWDARGEPDKAIARYTRAIELDPLYAMAFNNRGWARFQKGDLGRALEDLNTSIELDPDYPFAWNNRACVRGRRGDYKGTIADCSEAIRLDPGFTWPYDNRAAARKKMGDILGAVEDYTRSIELDPEQSSTYFQRGYARSDLGDSDGAIADYTRAVGINSSYAMAYNNRGWEYFQKGEDDRALMDFKKALEAKPDLKLAMMNCARVFSRKGNLDGAIAEFTKVIQLDPQCAEAYNKRGMARQAKGDLKGALADYDKAIETDPNYFFAYINRGAARPDEEADAAIADFDRAIELNPSYAMTYNNRGWAYWKKGELDKALADYQKALELDPKYWKTWQNIALVYQKQGKFEEALKAWDKTLELNAQAPPYAHNYRAGALLQLGRYEEAASGFRKTTELLPGNATAWYNLACAYARTGKKEKALSALTKSLGLDEKNELKELAKTDPDLEPLRDNPVFKQLTGQ